MKILAMATATIGLALTASPAFAGSDSLPRQSVSTAGLDLDTPEGQLMLDQRIDTNERCG